MRSQTGIPNHRAALRKEVRASFRKHMHETDTAKVKLSIAPALQRYNVKYIDIMHSCWHSRTRYLLHATFDYMVHLKKTWGPAVLISNHIWCQLVSCRLKSTKKRRPLSPSFSKLPTAAD